MTLADQIQRGALHLFGEQHKETPLGEPIRRVWDSMSAAERNEYIKRATGLLDRLQPLDLEDQEQIVAQRLYYQRFGEVPIGQYAIRRGWSDLTAVEREAFIERAKSFLRAIEE